MVGRIKIQPHERRNAADYLSPFALATPFFLFPFLAAFFVLHSRISPWLSPLARRVSPADGIRGRGDGDAQCIRRSRVSASVRSGRKKI